MNIRPGVYFTNCFQTENKMETIWKIHLPQPQNAHLPPAQVISPGTTLTWGSTDALKRGLKWR